MLYILLFVLLPLVPAVLFKVAAPLLWRAWAGARKLDRSAQIRQLRRLLKRPSRNATLFQSGLSLALTGAGAAVAGLAAGADAGLAVLGGGALFSALGAPLFYMYNRALLLDDFATRKGLRLLRGAPEEDAFPFLAALAAAPQHVTRVEALEEALGFSPAQAVALQIRALAAEREHDARDQFFGLLLRADERAALQHFWLLHKTTPDIYRRLKAAPALSLFAARRRGYYRARSFRAASAARYPQYALSYKRAPALFSGKRRLPLPARAARASINSIAMRGAGALRPEAAASRRWRDYMLGAPLAYPADDPARLARLLNSATTSQLATLCRQITTEQRGAAAPVLQALAESWGHLVAEEPRPRLSPGRLARVRGAFAERLAIVERARDELAARQQALLAALPAGVCARCLERVRLRADALVAYVECPACGRADAVETAYRKVAGYIGAAPPEPEPGVRYAPMWDEKTKRAAVFGAEEWQIAGGADIAYDWAVNAVLEAWANAGRPLDELPLRLSGDPPLAENTRRLIKTPAEAGFSVL